MLESWMLSPEQLVCRILSPYPSHVVFPWASVISRGPQLWPCSVFCQL